MDCSSVESWRLMLRRFVSVLSRSWSVDAALWIASSWEMPGEIWPGPGRASVPPSPMVIFAGGVFLAISAGGFPFPLAAGGWGVGFWAALVWCLGLNLPGLLEAVLAVPV